MMLKILDNRILKIGKTVFFCVYIKEDPTFRRAGIIRGHFAILKNGINLETNFKSEKCYIVANLILLFRLFTLVTKVQSW